MINMTQGDCMELMASKPDNYYSLAIVDPPYGIKYRGVENPTDIKGGKKRTKKYIGGKI